MTVRQGEYCDSLHFGSTGPTLRWFHWVYQIPHINKALDSEPFSSRLKSAPSGIRRGFPGWPVVVGFQATSNGRGISFEHTLPTGAGGWFIAAAVVTVEYAHGSDQIKQPIMSV